MFFDVEAECRMPKAAQAFLAYGIWTPCLLNHISGKINNRCYLLFKPGGQNQAKTASAAHQFAAALRAPHLRNSLVCRGSLAAASDVGAGGAILPAR